MSWGKDLVVDGDDLEEELLVEVVEALLEGPGVEGDFDKFGFLLLDDAEVGLDEEHVGVGGFELEGDGPDGAVGEAELGLHVLVSLVLEADHGGLDEQ